MLEMNQMISIYQIAFKVCLVLTILFFALAAFMFFKFDIRKIFDAKTGRGARKSIQKMEEINAKTGKLRADMVARKPMELRKENGSSHIQETINQYTDSLNVETSTGSQETEKLIQDSGSMETSVLNQGGEETTLLQNTEPLTPTGKEGSAQTEMLSDITNDEYMPETTLLGISTTPLTEKLPRREMSGKFEIIKEVMWVHTKEILN